MRTVLKGLLTGAAEPRVLLRAGALGLATGGRSTAAVAALAAGAAATDRPPLHRLAALPVRIAVGLAAAAELVVDLLPATPPRTALPGLLPRLLLAPAAAVVAQRRATVGPVGPAVAPAIVAAAAAAGAAWAGTGLRALLARRLGRDLPGALAEDVLVAALAWAGAGRARPPAD